MTKVAHRGHKSASAAESIAMASKVVGLDTHLVQAWDLMASQYLNTGQLQEPVKALRHALSIDPKDRQALSTLIVALRKDGSRAEIQKLVQKLTQLRKEQDLENSRSKRYG
jgi:cytochrome c-type biogenesis protein CcmH/NrfG